MGTIVGKSVPSGASRAEEIAESKMNSLCHRIHRIVHSNVGARTQEIPAIEDSLRL